MSHDSDDFDPDPGADEFHQQFEVVIRPRPGSRLRPSAPAPVVEAKPPLPPPLIPFPDPIPRVMLHGSISTLSGASGVGKTAYLAGFLRDLKAGHPIHGHQVNPPAAIGFISVDRPYRDHQVWFGRAGFTPDAYYDMQADDAINWDLFREYKRVPILFAEALDRLALPPGSFVVVDPIPVFVAGKLIDYKDAAIGMSHIGRAIRARQLTLLGVFHVGKEKGNKSDRYLRPQDRILGSGGQVGYSETAMFLMSPVETDQGHYTLGWAPHQIPEQSFKMQRTDTGLFLPLDDLDIYSRQSEDRDRALACFVSDTIHFAAWLTDRIMTACACKERHAKELISLLLRDGQIEKVSRGNYRRILPPAVTGTDPT